METTGTELRLVLIGVTSYDIQGTANEIVGKTIYPSLQSTTEFKQWDLCEAFGGRSITVTVAPGFMDNRREKKPWQMKADIQYELQKSDYENGFHGVVMVMSYPFRWTDEEKATIQFAIDIMKQTNLKKHGFLVLTNGHNFKTKYPRDTEREFHDYLHRQGESEQELKMFLNLFCDRIFILDTELDDAEWNGYQVRRLYNSLSQIPGTFSLYASALVGIYNRASDIMSFIFRCFKTAYSYTPLPYVVSSVGSYFGWNAASGKTRGRKSESFVIVEHPAEGIQDPLFKAQGNVEELMHEATTQEQ